MNSQNSFRGRDREIVYIVSHFPNLTETFVYRELISLRNLGQRVSLLALHAPRPLNQSKEFGALDSVPVRHDSMFSCLIRACVTLISHPGRSLGLLGEGFRACWKDPVILVKMFFCLLKAAGFATRRVSGVRHILHAHFCHLEAACAYFIHRLVGTPYVIINHVQIFYLPDRLIRSVLDNALLVVCDFEWNRKELTRRFPIASDKTETIHGGIFLPDCPPEFRLAGKVSVILNIGRLRPTKGQVYLVEACDLLRKKGIRFRCEIVGEGDQRQSLADRIRDLGLEDSVILRGSCSWEGLEKYYREADVFAFPCVRDSQGGWSDGVPTVLLEAMGRGIPIVTSSLPGPGEVVREGETGAVVPERDSTALAKALERVLSDEELRERYIRNGWEHLRNKFDIGRNVARLLRLEREKITEGELS